MLAIFILNNQFNKVKLNISNLENYMHDLLQRDLGSSLLSMAVILGWLGLFFVFLRILTILIKRMLEVIFKIL